MLLLLIKNPAVCWVLAFHAFLFFKLMMKNNLSRNSRHQYFHCVNLIPNALADYLQKTWQLSSPHCMYWKWHVGFTKSLRLLCNTDAEFVLDECDHFWSKVTQPHRLCILLKLLPLLKPGFKTTEPDLWVGIQLTESSGWCRRDEIAKLWWRGELGSATFFSGGRAVWMEPWSYLVEQDSSCSSDFGQICKLWLCKWMWEL